MGKNHIPTSLDPLLAFHFSKPPRSGDGGGNNDDEHDDDDDAARGRLPPLSAAPRGDSDGGIDRGSPYVPSVRYDATTLSFPKLCGLLNE